MNVQLKFFCRQRDKLNWCACTHGVWGVVVIIAHMYTDDLNSGDCCTHDSCSGTADGVLYTEVSFIHFTGYYYMYTVEYVVYTMHLRNQHLRNQPK